MNLSRTDTALFSVRAAMNNAAWCDTVCRIHGRAGHMGELYWHTTGHVPRFYPNLVTLSAAQEAGFSQVEQICHIASEIGLVEWGVKDSFNCLDLTSLGFVRKFEANWFWRGAHESLPKNLSDEIRWSRVTTPRELEEWELKQEGEPARSRVFLDPILDEPDLAIFAARLGSGIVGGVIANHWSGVVGLSNAFAAPRAEKTFWSDCVVAVSAVFPGMPITGYEHGRNLQLATEAGFESLHPLSVWVSSASSRLYSPKL